jgi:spore coat polysaccharide biosynthesis protein SpsF
MKAVAVIVARMTSNRLPGKPLLALGGKTNIERHVERLHFINGLSETYLATAKSEENDPLVFEAKRLGLKVYRGEEEDIVERFEGVAAVSGADVLVRIGCDKPFFCFDILQKALNEYDGEDYVYLPRNVLKGVRHELISSRSIQEIHQHYRGTAVAQLMRQRPHQFRIKIQQVDKVYERPEYRLDLDTPEDYKLLNSIFDHFPSESLIHSRDAIAFLDDNPELALINREVQEKNVNLYSDLLEEKNVFNIVVDDNGRYVVFDRMGDHIPYLEFNSLVHDKKRWTS